MRSANDAIWTSLKESSDGQRQPERLCGEYRTIFRSREDRRGCVDDLRAVGSANLSRDPSGPWHVRRCHRRVLLSVSAWPIGAVRPNGPAQTWLDVSWLAGVHE